MSLSETEFRTLCNETGRLLDLFDPQAMGHGEAFQLHEVTCQLLYSEPRGSVFLRYDLGDPEPGCEADAYRQLLDIQMALFGMLDATFGRDPVNDSLLFMVRLPLHAGLTAEGFAQAVSQFARQVRAWQQDVLAGQLIDYEREFEKMFPSSAPASQPVAGGAA